MLLFDLVENCELEGIDSDCESAGVDGVDAGMVESRSVFWFSAKLVVRGCVGVVVEEGVVRSVKEALPTPCRALKPAN